MHPIALADDSSPPSRSQHTVLVIDGDAAFRATVRAALAAAGFRALESADGEAGLALAATASPSVVLVDAQLPGLDGHGVVRRIRRDPSLQHVPCMMLTDAEASGSEGLALEAGADVFLSKRTPPAEIVARVHALLTWSTELPVSSPEPVLGAKRVLLVGDGAAIAAALVESGYDVVRSPNGVAASELLLLETPASVLVDRATPEVVAVVRAALSGPSAVVALVDDLADAAVLACFRAGADEVVARTTSPVLLAARVRAHLRRKRLEEDTARQRGARLARELTISETRTAQALAEQRSAHLAELERKNAELAAANAELEAFSYSVSHDLRSPLRAIAGFTRALEEDEGHLLGDVGRGHLRRILGASHRMGELIDDLLQLARLTRSELKRERVDLSRLASAIASDLAARTPTRDVRAAIALDVVVEADAGMLRVLLENLLGNAWKFTQKTAQAEVEVGAHGSGSGRVFFVRDNGVGFDMRYAKRLFQPFQRLHGAHEFEGTGVGLATVARIVSRHGGRVWAEAAPNAGATISFTLG